MTRARTVLTVVFLTELGRCQRHQNIVARVVYPDTAATTTRSTATYAETLL